MLSVAPERSKNEPVASPFRSTPGLTNTTENQTRSGSHSGWDSFAGVVLLSATGFALVCLAYARGRAGSSGADVYFWAGQLLMFMPLVGRVLIVRRQSLPEALGLVVAGAVAQYLIRCMYDPLGFTFSDEFSHLKTAQNILTTHHLFGANFLLPVSPQYPGLEIVTTALASLSGASIHMSGLIVVGAAHVLLILALFALLWGASGSVRIAALGALIYQTSPHYQFFDSYFVYQNLAVPLLIVTLLIAASEGGMLAGARGGRLPARNRTPVRILCLLTSASVIVSHHVTMVALVTTLLLFLGFRTLARRRPRRLLVPPAGGGRWLGQLLLATVTLGCLWVLLVATSTVNYLGPTVTGLTNSVVGLFGSGNLSTGAAAQANPLIVDISTYAMTGLVALVLPWGAWSALRSRGSTLASLLALTSLAYYALIVLRLVSSDGAELAGRSFTFVYVPVCYALAVGALALRRTRIPRWLATGIALGGIGILFVGGIESGWPPYWERLPGPYQVSGLDRSLSPPDVAVAQWFASALPPGNRVALDLADYPLIGSIGDQNPLRDGAPLFYAPVLTPRVVAFARRASIHYVVTDSRLTRALPASGRYFPDDPRAYDHREPLSRQDLRKFLSIPGVSRVYDNGAISVYDLNGSALAP